jgi:hypothetical protein
METEIISWNIQKYTGVTFKESKKKKNVQKLQEVETVLVVLLKERTSSNTVSEESLYKR